MNDANIKNDCNTLRMGARVYQTLTTAERNKLKKRVQGRGNLQAAWMSMGIAVYTLRRAIEGFALQPETAAKIRAFLETK